MRDAKRQQTDRLIENIIAEFRLICDGPTNGVLHVEVANGFPDEAEAIDYFYEAGWRVIRRKLYCPDCAKARGLAQSKDCPKASDGRHHIEFTDASKTHYRCKFCGKVTSV